jgi:hypothetical protein
MNKQDLAILIQTMEAQRKAGGFSFDVMPLAAQTMQKLSDLFNLMKPESRLVIEQLHDAQVVPDAAPGEAEKQPTKSGK